MTDSVPFHSRMQRQASTLRASARLEVPDLASLHRAMGELIRVYDEARRVGPPADAHAGWGHNSNAVLAAGAMGLRTAQALELLIRSGYGMETAGLVRKLGEATQHAAGAAQDPAGDYARNWAGGRGEAGKASKAYMRGVENSDGVRDKWNVLSQMEHANLKPFVNFACEQAEDGRVLFPVMPRRHAALDVQAATSAAWDLLRIAAAICAVYPDIGQRGTLELAGETRAAHEDADRRIGAWVEERMKLLPKDG